MPQGRGKNALKHYAVYYFQKGTLLSKAQEEIRKILSEETLRDCGAISPEGGSRQCHKESLWSH